MVCGKRSLASHGLSNVYVHFHCHKNITIINIFLLVITAVQEKNCVIRNTSINAETFVIFYVTFFLLCLLVIPEIVIKY